MRRYFRRLLLLLIDLGLIIAATALAILLRDNFEISLTRWMALFPYVANTLLVSVFVLAFSGVENSFWRFTAMGDYLRIVAAAFAIVVATLALRFTIDRLDDVSRSLPFMQWLLITFAMVGARVLARLRYIRRRGAQHSSASTLLSPGVQESVLVVGLGPVTDLFLRSVAEFGSERIRIVGIVGRSEQHGGRRLHRHKILGVPENSADIVKTLEVHGISVDRIVVTVAFADLSVAAQETLLKLERGSAIRLDFFAERIGLAGERSGASDAERVRKTSTDDADLVGFFDFRLLAQRRYFRLKRAIDICVAALLAIIAAPLILLVGLVAALDVGLPVIFWQQRPGLNGRPFRLYKFRTMRSAHDRSGDRIADDLRLSLVGVFLRRTRLDELPQLYNILVGDMSFVGPRPLLPIDQSPAFAARLLVRPGLTGWAQVAGGREISARDKAAMDIWYVRNASISVDLGVLARTVPMIILGERPNLGALRRAWMELEALKAGPDSSSGSLGASASQEAASHAA